MEGYRKLRLRLMVRERWDVDVSDPRGKGRGAWKPVGGGEEGWIDG